MNRQESHRIYLQLFAPRSASQPQGSVSDGALLHRHSSHEIHPPNYPITAGGPYQFSSSSSESSYSFSSLSTNNNSPAPNRTSNQDKLNVRSPSSPQKNRYVGQPATVTTSAAVRLTEKARSKDVTALLRGKFGLPQISNNNKNVHKQQHDGYYSSQKGYGFRHSDSNTSEIGEEEQHEVDALVLIGTIENNPKGYIRFEHEEYTEEKQRLELFHQYYNQQQAEQQSFKGALASRENSEVLVGDHQHNLKMATEVLSAEAHLPISESTATVRASGGQAGWTSSMQLANSGSEERLASGGGLATSTSGIGLDLSSSRGTVSGRGSNGGGNAGSSTPWATLKGDNIMDLSSSCGGGGKLTTLVSELSVTPSQPTMTSPRAPMKSPELSRERSFEPIHIVKTVLPDEHPLSVRDEMLTSLMKRRQEAEEEMGYNLDECRERSPQRSQPTFRWYFQPCSPLGCTTGHSVDSPKIQSIPAYIDLEGYCTEEDDCSESDHDEDSEDNVNEDECKESIAGMNQLIEERKRITLLQDLSDPSFLVSGYLLKQSNRDPNVWRRVFCVLSNDRMWTINRMKPLKEDSNTGSGDILSFLRVSRHRHIYLHRCLLIERGEGSQPTRQYSSSRYSGYYLAPLDSRLPNTFRILTASQKCHTFRAYNSLSFRVWTTSISDKISQKHNDGLIDLANVIAEEETLARCKRMDDIAVTPLSGQYNETLPSTTIPMAIVRFGMAVASYKELCRHVTHLIRQYKNHHGKVVNVQTKVSSKTPSSPTSGVQPTLNMEHVGMVSSTWEEARLVASKSAQLLHTLATLQHDKELNQGEDRVYDGKEESEADRPNPSNVMEELIEEQKSVQAILGKHWDNPQKDETTGRLSLPPPMQLFDKLLSELQSW